MSDLQVRSDSVDVEQIMKQIRTRIKEKRGTDYTETELQQLASVKLQQFADPSGLRSDLLEQFRQKSNEPSTYHRHTGPRRWLLMLFHPLLKRIQKQMMADLNLYFEIIHNLVVETTRLGIENQNLKMRVESLSSRVDFDERRSRALEGVVQYKPDALPRQRPYDNQRHQQPQQTPRYQPPPQQQQSTQPPASPTPQPVVTPSGPGAPASTSTGPANVPSGNRPPDQQGRPDGRKRRRRRRRRPGGTLADSPSAAGGNTAAASAPDFRGPVDSGNTSSDADDQDEDDGPEQ